MTCRRSESSVRNFPPFYLNAHGGEEENISLKYDKDATLLHSSAFMSSERIKVSRK